MTAAFIHPEVAPGADLTTLDGVIEKLRGTYELAYNQEATAMWAMQFATVIENILAANGRTVNECAPHS